MVYLITGVAGFIGFYVAKALLEQGEKVIGIDSLNDYYSVSLKKTRYQGLEKFENFCFYKADVSDREAIKQIFSQHPEVDYIVHLAAQAGVRYSLQNPYDYIQTNVMGQLVILEQARNLRNLKRIFYASSSSVYGLNKQLPFNERDRVDCPSSVYAVSKRSAELLSFSYSHIYGLKQTGLRFFTVYGPWGRPDMACYQFAQAILQQKPLVLYSGETLSRDFTYVEDVVSAMLALFNRSETNRDGLKTCDIFNIGKGCQERVGQMIVYLEDSLGKKAVVEHRTRPETDVEETLADISDVHELTGWSPKIDLKTGIGLFSEWFLRFHDKFE